MIWHKLTHWPTHPPNHPPIHLSKGGSVSTNHKSSNRIKLSWLDQVLLNFEWFHMFWPINPPTHSPTHQTKHQPMGGEFSTNFKSLNRIQISRFIQVLLQFYWFGGYPTGGSVGGWMGVVLGGGIPHARAHIHTHAHMHTHVRTHIHAC